MFGIFVGSGEYFSKAAFRFPNKGANDRTSGDEMYYGVIFCGDCSDGSGFSSSGGAVEENATRPANT